MFARKKCQFWINDLIIFKIVIFYTEHLIVFQPNMTWILKKRASVYFYKTSKHLKNKPQELNEKRKFGNFLQPIMAFTFSIFILFWQRSDFYKKMPNYHFSVIFWENWLWNHQDDTKIEKIEAIETSFYPEEEVSVTVRTSNVDRKLRNNYSLSTKKYFKYSSDKIQERMTHLHVETVIK